MSEPFDLLDRLLRAWCAATSVDPDGWTPENPAHGQCAVTALVVQDLLGGVLIRTEVDGVSHYANGMDTGEIVDLTRSQFGVIKWADQVWEQRERAYVLSWPDTARRYALLTSLLSDR